MTRLTPTTLIRSPTLKTDSCHRYHPQTIHSHQTLFQRTAPAYRHRYDRTPPPAEPAPVWERLQRGWSYEELAGRIRAEMARSSETETGLSANTVRRWETGERWPDPRYRKHIVVIFSKPATELG